MGGGSRGIFRMYRLRSTAPVEQESENLRSASGGFFVALVQGNICL